MRADYRRVQPAHQGRQPAERRRPAARSATLPRPPVTGGQQPGIPRRMRNTGSGWGGRWPWEPYCGHSLRWEPSGWAPQITRSAARRGRGQFIAVVSVWYARCQGMRSCSTRSLWRAWQCCFLYQEASNTGGRRPARPRSRRCFFWSFLTGITALMVWCRSRARFARKEYALSAIAAGAPAWPAQAAAGDADRIHQQDEPRGVTVPARAGQPRDRGGSAGQRPGESWLSARRGNGRSPPGRISCHSLKPRAVTGGPGAAGRPDGGQGQVDADEGGGADGRAAEVAGLVAGGRGDAQEGEGAGAGGSGERVWQPADRRVDGGERGTASRTSQAPPLQDHDQCCCPAIPGSPHHSTRRPCTVTDAGRAGDAGSSQPATAVTLFCVALGAEAGVR